jgi:3-methyl-2-oxobutanoate hydroxymethyltransferase
MDAVKLEGGKERADAVKGIVNAGIPVMGHIGLTPQSINQFGGFVSQGKTAEAAKELIQDAVAMQEAGCFALVLEAVPPRLAEHITKMLDIPTIGIGAGVDCDGQVLVIHDLLGMFDRFTPRFVKQYTHLHTAIHHALNDFREDVETRAFPTAEHTYPMKDEEWDRVIG